MQLRHNRAVLERLLSKGDEVAGRIPARQLQACKANVPTRLHAWLRTLPWPAGQAGPGHKRTGFHACRSRKHQITGLLKTVFMYAVDLPNSVPIRPSQWGVFMVLFSPNIRSNNCAPTALEQPGRQKTAFVGAPASCPALHARRCRREQKGVHPRQLHQPGVILVRESQLAKQAALRVHGVHAPTGVYVVC